MGLEQVIGEVRKDGEGRAETILGNANTQAKALLDQARQSAKAHAEARAKQAARDADQARAQILSHAEFEARKTVLTAEAALRKQLEEELLEGFAGLPAKTREAHVKKLLATAKKVIGGGKVWCSAKDEKTIKAQKTFAFGGTSDISGGIVVESADGTNRLDLSYETLLGDMWRDVLRSEAALFR